MSQSYDAIVIGAGVIGACRRSSWPGAAGGRSTSTSCRRRATARPAARARSSAPTTRRSMAGARIRGFFDWADWAGYLGVPDERGLAAFHKTGCLVMRTGANGYLQSVALSRMRLASPWEDWGPEQIPARLPFYDLRAFGPPKRPDDPAFGEAHGGRTSARCSSRAPATSAARSWPRTTPSAPRRPRAQRSASTPKWLRSAGERSGRRHHSDVGRTDRRAGRQRRRPAFVQGQPHGRGRGRHELDPRSSRRWPTCVPGGFDFERLGLVTSGFRRRLLLPPGDRQPPADRQRRPAVRCPRVGDPDDYDRNFSEQWQVQVQRVAQRIQACR